jgi:hypothetical protein
MLPSAEALIKAKQSVEMVHRRRHNLRRKTLSLSSRLALTLVKNWGMRMLRDACCCIWCDNRTLQRCNCAALHSVNNFWSWRAGIGAVFRLLFATGVVSEGCGS